jgi:hypothetical protein
MHGSGSDGLVDAWRSVTSVSHVRRQSRVSVRESGRHPPRPLSLIGEVCCDHVP